MRVRFAKTHGQGNDFVVIDGVRQAVTLAPERVKALADRHFGVGFDQLLLVEKPREAGNDFRYRIWNADGGEVEQCGNGARCFARYVRDEGLTRRELAVETASGVIRPHVEDSGLVTVDMGEPRFAPTDVPFTGSADVRITYQITVGGVPVEMSVLSMGNPHAVQIVADVESAPVTTQGPLLEHHPRSRTASTPATCRCSSGTASGYGSGSAARARRSPAARAPARRWWRASGEGCSRRWSRRARAAAETASLGQAATPL